jgi:putative endopeptidase
MKILSTLASCILLVFLIGCKPSEPARSSGITLENIDTTASPGNNFFQYANGAWLARTEIPSDKSNYGTFPILRDRAQDDVKTIIEESATQQAAKGTDAQKVGDLYSSYMNVEKRNALGIAPLQEDFAKIESIATKEDVMAYVAHSMKVGFRSPLSIYVRADYSDPTMNAVMVGQSGLGLPERDYYVNPSPQYEEIRKDYKLYISNMLSFASIANSDNVAKEIFDLETSIAKIHVTKEELRDANKANNPFAYDSLKSAYPNLLFGTIFSTFGVDNLDRVNVGQPTYLNGLNALVSNVPVSTWKHYFKYHAINSYASILSEEIEKVSFDFFSKRLNGVPAQQELWRRGVGVVNNHLGEIVGKIYVGKFFQEDAKKRMVTLVENLLQAYEASIKELTWMSDETKTEALAKLHKFTPKIGYPDAWRDYTNLTIEPDDLVGNIRRSNAFRFQQRFLDKIGKPIDRTEWFMTPQTVNAYYSSSSNEIVFPAAILQPPFFNLAADDAVNYGAIGAVIGHEIGHGFDDQGSTFDGDGKLRNWWTDHDREEFKKRTSALVDQYNSFEVLPNVFVNGTFTLGENIGDLGGLSIAFKAYQLSLNGKEAPIIDGFTGVQRFFLGWAQGWKGKYREESLREQVRTDPHSPIVFRVNGVVRNIPEFYEAFGVSEKDSLYLAPEKRVKIW